ncbi:MAG: alpha/beta hydrolase [Gammaproteobacteria bacterium]
MLSITLFILLISLWGFYFSIRPIRIISPTTPKDFGIAYEAIEFKTADNILIKGWFIPSEHPHAKTIILLHGYPADKGDILPSRIFLHKKYNLLFLDFRYLGESQGRYSTLGKNEALDLRAALDYLNKRGIHSVGVWGLSLGAAVALLSAPEAPEIKAIVAESSFARLDWLAYNYYQIPGLDYIIGNLLGFWAKMFITTDIKTVQPVKAVKQLNIPLLLIYSKADQVITYKHALLMQEATQSNANVEFIIVNDAPHGKPIENYQEKITDFFDTNLK